MKAEHRKELQTNVLADALGRLSTRLTTQQFPLGKTILYLGLAAVILLGFAFWRWYSHRSLLETAELWAELEDGHKIYIDKLKYMKGMTKKGEQQEKEYWQTNAGRAARFQYAWYAMWTQGIRLLGADSYLALKHLDGAKAIYEHLAEDCKGDPILEPEVLYHIAVIEETKAVVDREQLKIARVKYRELGDHPEYKSTAYGQMARERANLLDPTNKNGQYQEIATFYQDLQGRLKVKPPSSKKK